MLNFMFTNQTDKSASYSRARRNIFKIMLYISIAHILCWSSNQIIYMASQVFDVYVDRTDVFYNMSVIAVYINCCINPFIYLAFYTAFRQELKRRFRTKLSLFYTPSDMAITSLQKTTKF